MNSVKNLLLAPINNLNNKSFNLNLNSLNSSERRFFLESILKNKYSPIFFEYLIENDLEKSFYSSELKLLRNQVERYKIQNLEIVKEVLFLNEIFKKHKLNPIYLKGVSLMNEFSDISTRTSYDIDILFSEKQIFKAYKILKENGYKHYRVLEKSDKELKNYIKNHHDLPELCRETNIMVELHYRVTSPQDFSECPITNHILKNKSRFMFFGEELFRPNINDMITHLILHFSIHNFFEQNPLRLFFDINQLEKNYNVDWKEICNAYNNEKVQKAILLTLSIINYDFELTNNFNQLKKNYNKKMPSKELILFSHNKVFFSKSDNKIPFKTIRKMSYSRGNFGLFFEIIRRLYISKDDVVYNNKLVEDNFFYSFLFMVKSFYNRIILYFTSAIKLVFRKGSVYNDYVYIKKIQKWID